MKRYVKYDSDTELDDLDEIMCMSNVRGKKVVHPSKLPFSFYYSTKSQKQHSIRVKPIFNDNRMSADLAGTLKLCDDWSYVPGKENRRISHSEIRIMKQFFQSNIVLFCLVWDMQVNEPLLADYLQGEISLHEFIEDLDFYREYKQELDKINTVKELENFCRKNKLVNFYGN